MNAYQSTSDEPNTFGTVQVIQNAYEKCVRIIILLTFLA